MSARQLSRERRQKIIDDYLAQSGANQYVPDEFVSWLSTQPDNPAYAWFDWNDETAAHAHRVNRARVFASGLRVSHSIETVGRSGAVKVSVITMPAMISPMQGWRDGGGYTPLKADDAVSMDAYCDEAARALDAWCRRYEAAVAHRGGDLAAVRKLLTVLARPKDAAA